MVQNMSVFKCPKCRYSMHIFGSDGVARECSKHQVDLLGDIPLDAQICSDADRGKPTMVADPESESAGAFLAIAETLQTKLELR